ncbi:MAG TPA: hypothetical protein PLR18_03250, partial [bacterium]|nr:hypothetical protein [bacterium]
ADCSTKNITTVDATGNVGYYPSLALGTDGFARVAYYDATNNNLKFAQCTNADCSTKNITTVDATGNVGYYPSLALGTDGFARVAYYDATNYNLKFAQCTNADCSAKNITTVGTDHLYSSLILGSDGFPRIAFVYDDGNGAYSIKLATCSDDACSAPAIAIVVPAVPDALGDIGSLSLGLSAGNIPKVAYGTFYQTRLAICEDAACGQVFYQTLADNVSPYYSEVSLKIGTDDLARIVYGNYGHTDYQENIYYTMEAREGGYSGLGDYKAMFSNLAASSIFGNSGTLNKSLSLGQNLGVTETALQINPAAGFTGDLITAAAGGDTRFVVTGGGNVGIGTTTPYSALTVVNDSYTAPKFMVASSTGFTTPSLYVASNGNVGIGTTTPSEALVVTDTTSNPAIVVKSSTSKFVTLGVDDGDGEFVIWDNNSPLRFATADSDDGGGWSEKMRITATGQLGIGTTTPWEGMKLAVDGDVLVTGDIYKSGTAYVNPDYVFAQYFGNPYNEVIPEDYELLALSDLEQYVRDNSHLPGVSFNGGPISLFESNRLNLEKIEELSLYILELNTRLGVVETGGVLQNASIEIPNTPIQDIVVLNHPLTVNYDLVVAGHSYFNTDSVGQAKILAGTTTVEIVFEKEYEYLPIVTISAYGEEILTHNIRYSVINASSTGFMIKISESLDQDLTFNWHAFASPEAKLFISDGTNQDLQLSINNEQLTIDNPIVIDQPIGSFESAPTDEDNLDAGVVAGESTTTEETTIEEPTVEDPVVEEPTVTEPMIEELVVGEPVAEDPIAEEPAVETPIEESTAETPAEVLTE